MIYFHSKPLVNKYMILIYVLCAVGLFMHMSFQSMHTVVEGLCFKLNIKLHTMFILDVIVKSNSTIESNDINCILR